MSWKILNPINEIEFSNKPLTVSAKEQELADSKWPEIEALGGWNGEVMFGHFKEDKLICQKGQYLWTQVPIKPGGNAMSLGVVGLIYKGGKYLWVQRGPKVVSSGTWSFSAAGHWDLFEEPEVIMEKEAQEELGFSFETGQKTPWERLVLLKLEQEGRASLIIQVLTATANSDWVPVLDPKEASDYIWSEKPDLRWWAHSKVDLECWLAIEQLITTH